MHKTLHKTLTKKYCQPHVTHNYWHKDDNTGLVDLMREMKGFLQEAKNDLLQPRPEAITVILQRSKEN